MILGASMATLFFGLIPPVRSITKKPAGKERQLAFFTFMKGRDVSLLSITLLEWK